MYIYIYIYIRLVFRITGFSNHRTTETPNYRTTESPNYRITELYDIELLNWRITGLPLSLLPGPF